MHLCCIVCKTGPEDLLDQKRKKSLVPCKVPDFLPWGVRAGPRRSSGSGTAVPSPAGAPRAPPAPACPGQAAPGAGRGAAVVWSRAASACFKVEALGRCEACFLLWSRPGEEVMKTEPCLGPGAGAVQKCPPDAPQMPAFSPRDQAWCCCGRGGVMASCGPSGCCLPAG